MDKLESEPMGWWECARRCPRPSRRSRPCRFHHLRQLPAWRSDGGSSDTSSPLSNRSRPLSTREKIGDYFNGDTDATAFAVNVYNFWLIDFVLCSKIKTPILIVIHYSLRPTLQILYFPHLKILQVILYICSFKPRQIHRPIGYSYSSLNICWTNITNNLLFLTSIYCYWPFLIVTIKHLNQSFAAVSQLSDFVKYSFTIWSVVALIPVLLFD